MNTCILSMKLNTCQGFQKGQNSASTIAFRQINYVSRDAKILEKCIKKFTEEFVQIDLKYLLPFSPQTVTQRLISENSQYIKEGKIFPELRAVSDHHQLLSRHVIFLLQLKQKSKQ